MWKKIIIWGAVAIVALLLVIQLIPFGRQHTNPPITQEPPWDSPQTRELVSQACFDCHSNETKWPWYSNIAPASWLVQRDVNEGRSEMNFSEWDRSGRGEPDEAVGLVASGEMPPGSYLMTASRGPAGAAGQQGGAHPGLAGDPRRGDGRGRGSRRRRGSRRELGCWASVGGSLSARVSHR